MLNTASPGIVWLSACASYLNASWLLNPVYKGSFHTILRKHNLCRNSHQAWEWITRGAQSETFVCGLNKVLGMYVFSVPFILTVFSIEVVFKETVSRQRSVSGWQLSRFSCLKELIRVIVGSGFIEFEWEARNRGFSIISRLVIINLCALSSISGWTNYWQHLCKCVKLTCLKSM